MAYSGPLFSLSGSNVEGTLGNATPSKAVAIGGKAPDGTLQIPPMLNTFGDSITPVTYYPLIIGAVQYGYNETTLEKQRNNTEGTLLISAARTASSNSPDLTVYNGAKLAVYLDVTAASGTSPTLDVTVKAKDPASGKYFVIGTFAQKTGIASEAIFIGGGADVEFATRTYRIEYVIAGTTPSFTFSVGASMSVS